VEQEHDDDIPYPLWINDYSNLMDRSYPPEPAGWTASLGAPTRDNHVLINSGPNPIAADDEVAILDADAIEAGMSPTVPYEETGVIITTMLSMPSTTRLRSQINDTLIINKKIKALLLERHPAMDPDNIIGATSEDRCSIRKRPDRAQPGDAGRGIRQGLAVRKQQADAGR